MAIFKVGDRVRIVSVERCAEALGREATLLGFTPLVLSWDGRPYSGWYLRVDGLGEISPRGLPYCLRETYIEPLTPPGQKEFKAEDILHLPNLPDFKTMTPEFARAWGGA